MFISPVGQSVAAQRARDAPGGMLSAPRLQPRADALFQFGDDAVRDAGVNVLAGEAALEARVFGGHRCFLLGNGLHSAHATLLFGENGGSKRKDARSGRGITQPEGPKRSGGLHKPGFKKLSSKNQPGAEAWGIPVPRAREGGGFLKPVPPPAEAQAKQKTKA